MKTIKSIIESNHEVEAIVESISTGRRPNVNSKIRFRMDTPPFEAGDVATIDDIIWGEDGLGRDYKLVLTSIDGTKTMTLDGGQANVDAVWEYAYNVTGH